METGTAQVQTPTTSPPSPTPKKKKGQETAPPSKEAATILNSLFTVVSYNGGAQVIYCSYLNTVGW